MGSEIIVMLLYNETDIINVVTMIYLNIYQKKASTILYGDLMILKYQLMKLKYSNVILEIVA